MTGDNAGEPVSPLRYRGTDIDVRLGDHVTYRPFPFVRAKAAIVYYVPGQSPPHPEMIGHDVPHWAIRKSDGALIVWPYLPGELKASRGLIFVSRGDGAYRGLQPQETTGLRGDDRVSGE